MKSERRRELLNRIRRDIDHLDIELVKLLKERTEKVLLTRRLKEATEDLGREAEVLSLLGRAADRLAEEPFLHALYGTILQESKRKQNQNPVLAGFAGEHGAYSELAVRHWNREWTTITCKSPEELLGLTREGCLDYAVLPIESTAGGVDRLAHALLTGCGLYINGAVNLAVEHSLLTLPGTSYRDIHTVYSHPQALSQCREFIGRHKLQAVSTRDTGQAAMQLAAERISQAAVIGSKAAAALYNLEVIKENIQDRPDNRTRFLILGRSEVREFPGKCSLMFKYAGGLSELLTGLTASKVPIVRLESQGDDQPVAIFADFAVENQESYQKLQEWLAQPGISEVMRLGCYRELRV